MNYFTLATVFLEISLFIIVNSHPARPTLLPLCSSEKKQGIERELHCVVYQGQHLDFDEIRTYTRDLPEGVKVNVSINCVDGGIIRLPWPFAAKNVVSLHVGGCINNGLLSERTVSYAQKDELKQVVLSNIRHRVTLQELHDSIVNIQNMSREYNCGPRNAVVQIFKNMQYVFPRSSGTVEELMLMEELMSASTVSKLISSVPECRFPNLRYLENSGSRSFSAYHLKLVESSQYPNLRVYSLRNNSLGTIPSEIATLQLNFLPSLSYLDLSNNDLTSADFVFRGKLVKNKLLINLRKNMIRTLSHRLVLDIVKTNSVILDIRENPLECSCDLFSYGEYLAGLKSTSASAVYKEATCQIDQSGISTSHSLSEKDFGHKLCNM